MNSGPHRSHWRTWIRSCARVCVWHAGSRAITSGKGKEWGVSLYTPVILKYRDEKTDSRVQLEELLR